MQGKPTGRCNTLDGHHIPCSDKNCEHYTTHVIDRCIRLEIPGEGSFEITKDVAEDWYKQLGDQLESMPVNHERHEAREMAMDENPTPLVGME